MTGDYSRTITTGTNWNIYPYVPYTSPNTNTYTYYYPTTVYLYQITCPKCKTKNWLELDKTKACSKCERTLRAVKERVDYEIAIEE